MANKTNTKPDLNMEFANSNDNISSALSKMEGGMKPLWGGFFNNSTNALTQKMLSTIKVDKRLYAIAIESTKAIMRMHIKRSIITTEVGTKLLEGLDTIRKEIAEGNFKIDSDVCDVYDAIEKKLSQLVGENVDFLYTARSKNDQIAGDLKLWIRDAYDGLDAVLQNLQAAIIYKAEENVKTWFPGYTHMQAEQPISLAHQLLAYVEMIGRDRSRIKDARARLNSHSPYGSHNLGGSEFHLNLGMVARALDFDKASLNSIDAVSDRDYVVEFAANASISAMHLSRIAEDLLFWQSPNNNFISFSNAFVEQNPMTPYKRDPKIIELVRGKTGKVYGSLVSVLTTLKGLPVSFSRDLQEVAEPIFESYDALFNSVNVMAALVTDFIINRKEMKEAAQYGFSTCTDVMNWLMIHAKATPKQAVVLTKKIIDLAVSKDTKLSLLELEELQAIHPKINNEIYRVLIASRAVISRRTTGGTNPVQSRKVIRSAKRRYL